MLTYDPSPELTKAVLAGILAPLPRIAGFVAWAVPGKELVVGSALMVAIPMGLQAIASAYPAGTRIALTRHGELTEETKQGILRRIASWFVPSEVTDVVSALQKDIVRLGHERFGQESWKLEATDGEIVLIVVNTSFLKVSADTVADTLMNSFDKLKGLKDKLPFVGAKQPTA